MVEGRRRPAARGMAERAIRWKSSRHVVRISGPCEVSLVTRVASRGSVDVVIVGVALHAGQRGMHSGQRVVRIHGVIELSVQPVDS